MDIDATSSHFFKLLSDGVCDNETSAAILVLACQVGEVADALQQLGNNPNGRDHGAMEGFAMIVRDSLESASVNISTAINEHG